MPMFDYKCTKCGESFEKLAKSADNVVECPKCGEDAEKQVCAPVTFQLNGGGYYKGGTNGRL
jgi:putative FmdB family regulatory protein